MSGEAPGVAVGPGPDPIVVVGAAAATTAAVRFGEGRSPEAATQVSLGEFDGPLGLLLTLIESRQLDVLTVPLGELADAYLDALATLEGDRLGSVSSFVAIASQLILIKSRAMLPRQPAAGEPGALEDDRDPESELRARLVLYRAYRDAGLRLAEVAQRRLGLFRREPSAARATALAGAVPADAAPLDPRILVQALGHLATIVPPPEVPPEVVPRTITLAERAELIRAALRGAPTVVLQDLLTGVRDRVVIAVTFLAMLELVKRREIVVEQAEPWGPIVARSTTAAERAALTTGNGAQAPVEPDAPIDESLESFR